MLNSTEEKRLMTENTEFFNRIIEWSFFGMVSVIGTGFLRAMRKLNQGVSDLNAKIAAILEKTHHHERTLEKHDERITVIERKRR